MDQPAGDSGLLHPLLETMEIRRVGETKIVRSASGRKISTELRLKYDRQPEILDGDDQMLPAKPLEAGFTRESLSAKRNFNRPVEMVTVAETPVAHVKLGVQHKTNSPISATLNENTNISSAGHSDIGDAKIDICIYFPDQQGFQFKVENGRHANSEFLLQLAANQKKVKPDRMSLWREAFALWMVSPLLEVQLKDYHAPYEVRRQWANFLRKYTNATSEEILGDEPMLMIRRNVTLSIERETQICAADDSALQVLFEDARTQFLLGRYAIDNCKLAAEMAGLSLATVIGQCPENDLGKLRSELDEHLPERHLGSVRGPIVFGKALSGTKEMEEVVLKAWKDVAKDSRRAMREYLEKARQSPCYGAAFFSGTIERPTLSFGQLFKQSWFTSSNSDIKVRVAVNMDSICVTDEAKGDLLLVQPIEDCSWSVIERKEQTDEEDEAEESSLLLHFPENISDSDRSGGEEPKKVIDRRKFRKSRKPRPTSTGHETKLLQVFCYQAVMIDALLKTMKELGAARSIQTDRHRSSSPEEGLSNESYEPSSSSSNEGAGGNYLKRSVGRQPSLTKGHRMCLATFDAEGHCLKAQGSLKKVLAVK